MLRDPVHNETVHLYPFHNQVVLGKCLEWPSNWEYRKGWLVLSQFAALTHQLFSQPQ